VGFGADEVKRSCRKARAGRGAAAQDAQAAREPQSVWVNIG
jgi:hypothetical protein